MIEGRKLEYGGAELKDRVSLTHTHIDNILNIIYINMEAMEHTLLNVALHKIVQLGKKYYNDS